MILLLLTWWAVADIVVLPEGEAAAAEAACDPSSRATADTECVRCSVYRGSRQRCEQFEAQGYTKVCETEGSKVSVEVLCRSALPPLDVSSKDGESGQAAGSCGCMQLAPAAGLPFLALAILPLRRRSRKPQDA